LPTFIVKAEPDAGALSAKAGSVCAVRRNGCAITAVEERFRKDYWEAPAGKGQRKGDDLPRNDLSRLISCKSGSYQTPPGPMHCHARAAAAGFRD